MNKPRLFVTRRWPDASETLLSSQFDTVFNQDDHPLSQSELQDVLQNYDAVLCTVTDQLGAQTLSAPQVRTKMLCNYGVGHSHIDLPSAQRLGITVTNTPDVLTDCTADLAMMMLLMSARRASTGEREIRDNAWTGWRPTHLLGTRVTGKTLGIVGFGRIGQAMARRAHFGFNMSVRVHSRRPVAPQILSETSAEYVSDLNDLLASCDFISLHCPGGAENTHLFDAHRLALMPNHAFLINTARGEVIDEHALAQALHNNDIAGAALDVYQNEPHVSEQLKQAPNLTLLPHLGSATSETREDMGRRAIANLTDFLEGRAPQDLVSAPEPR